MRIKLEGDLKLKAKLASCKNLTAVKTIVKQNGHELNTKMQRNMESAYSKGYSTGETKRSVTEAYSDGGMTATVGPETDYSPYVEYGTRYMTAEPAVRPAFQSQEPQFINDLKKLVN